MELNEFIKARRKALGLSLQDVGDSINYTPQAIRKFETGDVKIDIRLVGKLIKVLNVSLNCFLNADIEHIEEYKELPDFNAEKFVARLRYLRELTQITQADFANELGINKTRVSKIEHGESFPNAHEFIKIANFYKISFEELYEGRKTKEEVPIVDEPKINEVTPNEVNKDSKSKKIKSRAILIILLLLSNAFLLTTSVVFGINSINNSQNNEGDIGEQVDNYHEVTYVFDLSNEEIKEYVYHGKPAKNLIYRHEGYELVGYYLNDEPFDFSTPIISDIKITGKLKKKSFDVKFYDDKNEIFTETKALYLEEVTPPVLPQIQNKRFMKRNSEEYKEVKKDLSIYPIYNIYETKAFLNLNGGEFVDPQTPKTIDNFKYEDIYNLPKVVKKGYTFLGFAYKGEMINKNTIFDDVITLDAIYEANTYKISFSDCYLPELTVKFDEIINLPRVSNDGSREIERYYFEDYKTIGFDFIYNFDHDITLTPVFKGSTFSYYYNIKGDIAEIHSIEEDGSTLFIPATIDGFKVQKIKADALKDNENIKHLVIESDSVYIESGAFKNLPNLLSVDIGNFIGTARLEENIFQNCPNINYVKLGSPLNLRTKTVMRIAEYGFTQNNNLTVELDDKVTVLPMQFNKNFGKIKKLITGDGLKEIAKKHFDFDVLDLEEIVPGKNLKNVNIWLDENFKNKELTIINGSTWKINSDSVLKVERLVVETRSYFSPTCDIEVEHFIVQGDDCSGKNENLWITLSTNNKITANTILIGSKLNIIRPDTLEENPIFYPKEGKILSAYLRGTSVIPDYLNDKSWLGKPEDTKIYFDVME